MIPSVPPAYASSKVMFCRAADEYSMIITAIVRVRASEAKKVIFFFGIVLA